MRMALTVVLIVSGGLLVLVGVVLIVVEMVAALRARKHGVAAQGIEPDKVVDALGRLPQGDRLVVLGLVALGLAAVVDGSLGLSVG